MLVPQVEVEYGGTGPDLGAVSQEDLALRRRRLDAENAARIVAVLADALPLAQPAVEPEHRLLDQRRMEGGWRLLRRHARDSQQNCSDRMTQPRSFGFLRCLGLPFCGAPA